jgi:hypothetical protein
MLFKEITTDYRENQTKNVSTLCGNNAFCWKGLICFQELLLHTDRFVGPLLLGFCIRHEEFAAPL